MENNDDDDDGEIVWAATTGLVISLKSMAATVFPFLPAHGDTDQVMGCNLLYSL